jgi:hypothetical protein
MRGVAFSWRPQSTPICGDCESRSRHSPRHAWKVCALEHDPEKWKPVFGQWFTQGFDTRDLKDAKASLEEFAA